MRAEKNLPQIGVVRGGYDPEPRTWLVQMGLMSYYTPEQVYDICIELLEAAAEAIRKNAPTQEHVQESAVVNISKIWSEVFGSVKVPDPTLNEPKPKD